MYPSPSCGSTPSPQRPGPPFLHSLSLSLEPLEKADTKKPHQYPVLATPTVRESWPRRRRSAPPLHVLLNCGLPQLQGTWGFQPGFKLRFRKRFEGGLSGVPTGPLQFNRRTNTHLRFGASCTSRSTSARCAGRVVVSGAELDVAAVLARSTTRHACDSCEAAAAPAGKYGPEVTKPPSSQPAYPKRCELGLGHGATETGP
jgi:hypothetical protein